ncbi:MAG: guanylate kinase [Blastocatellia bacterium]|nr:guanylate kinase [Blastocatellia bacterium]
MSNEICPTDESARTGSPESTGEPRKKSLCGNLIVVSAPSGAGKSTLVEMAIARVDRLRYSISYTTRKARGTERHGVNYYFVQEPEFLAMRERGEFLESAEVHGYLYGTPAAETSAMMAEGLDVILDIDVQGATQIRHRLPEAITVFILPPSYEALERRLRSRNLNEPADLELRLLNALGEVRLYEQFKYVIVNDDLEEAVRSLEAIIVAERHRPERQRSAARNILSTFGGESLHA